MTDTPQSESADAEKPAESGPDEAKDAAEAKSPGWLRRWRPWLIVAGLSVVVVLLLAALTLPLWRPFTSPGFQTVTAALVPGAKAERQVAVLRDETNQLTAALSAVKTAQAKLQDRVAKLETRPAPTALPTTSAATAATGAELSALDQRMAALEKEQATSAIASGRIKTLAAQVKTLSDSKASAASVLSLTDRVGAVEKGLHALAKRQGRTVAFLLSVSQLKAAIEAGRPFAGEIATVRATAPTGEKVDPRLAGFAGFAAAGIPTQTTLAQRFIHLGPEIIRSGLAAKTAHAKWWRRVVTRMLSLVTVTRNNGSGDTPTALVGRAETMLGRGDLAAAVAEVERLEGAPAATAAPWLKAAEARLAAERGTADLLDEALARFNRTAGPATSAVPAGG